MKKQQGFAKPIDALARLYADGFSLAELSEMSSTPVSTVRNHLDRLNNHPNNLALLTRSGHIRLHRLQDQMQGIERERNQDGTWR